MVSDTITTPASAVRSACVKPRPLTTSMPSTSKYSDDTASWSTGTLLGRLGDTDVSTTPRVVRRRRGHDRHQRMGRQGLEQRGAPWFVVDGDPQRVARPHARILRRGGEGASQKYGGADQEESRCADLDGDQGMPCAARTRIPRHFAAHRPHQVEAGGLQRRREPEEHRRHDGASHQEHQHPPVRGGGGKVEQIHELGDLRRQRGDHRIERTLQKQPRDDKAAGRRRERKEEALREQLPDDAPA